MMGKERDKSSAKSTDIVCNCKLVTRKEVMKAIVRGALTVDEVGTLTGAGTGCGRCKPIIAQCIEGHLSNTPVLQLTIPFGHNGK